MPAHLSLAGGKIPLGATERVLVGLENVETRVRDKGETAWHGMVCWDKIPANGRLETLLKSKIDGRKGRRNHRWRIRSINREKDGKELSGRPRVAGLERRRHMLIARGWAKEAK